MRTTIIMLGFFTLMSCSKKDSGCLTKNKNNFTTSESNYQNFSAEAVFTLRDDVGLSIGFLTFVGDCYIHSHFSMRNIDVKIQDTVFLIKSLAYAYNITEPTARYNILHGDATEVEIYVLVEDADNFVIIDYINKDSSEISGRFSATFVTANEWILSGERERWDDPNRPDTLSFYNGQFLAVNN